MSKEKTENTSYGRRKAQIEKQDIYMLTALWMERSPWAIDEKKAEEKDIRVVGAVFVRPNDRVLSIDCSRSNDGGIVHGAIRALLQYPDQVEGCYVYLSRRPCAHCVKMLVQAAVKKVFYLPLKPEKDEEEENKSIDALFKVSPVSREVYVPHITQKVLEELKPAEPAKQKENPYGTQKLEDKSIAPDFGWTEDWMDKIESEIVWKEFSDKEIKDQVKEDMKAFFKWFNLGILATGEEKDMKWEKEPGGNTAGSEQGMASTSAGGDSETTPDQGTTSKTKDKLDQKVANHLSRLAQMLSYRTDDPNTGVGCVIALKDEIVGIGWNGFPSKALYGNHPRGSTQDQAKRKKYEHIIYALNNAVLFRNRREVDGCVVYHTIVPSDEGVSMLYQLGAKTLVLPSFQQEKEKEAKSLFYACLQEKKLIVYNQIRKENDQVGEEENQGDDDQAGEGENQGDDDQSGEGENQGDNV